MTSVLKFNEARPLIQKDAPATKENLRGITKKFIGTCLHLIRTMKTHTRKLIGVLGTASTLSYRAARGVVRACNQGTAILFLPF
jgi:hypothetical protein